MIPSKCTRLSGNKPVQIGQNHGKLPRSDASEFSMDLDQSNGKRVCNIAMNRWLVRANRFMVYCDCNRCIEGVAEATENSRDESYML
jgi:hypothetical protein